MAVCTCCSKVSEADSLVIAAVQIMTGIFCIFMWYLLLILYMGQIKGVFGTYEPITYKTGCSLWGIFFIISGISIIRATWYPSQRQLTYAMLVNILCIILAIISMILTIVELSTFKSVSYRNYGQAKLGREISRVLLSFYPLEVSMALTYAVFGCVGLMNNDCECVAGKTSLQGHHRKLFRLKGNNTRRNSNTREEIASVKVIMQCRKKEDARTADAEEAEDAF